MMTFLKAIITKEIHYLIMPIVLTQSQIDQLMNGGIDGEADLFTFTAGGYSAKFYFNKQKQPIIIGQARYSYPAYREYCTR